MTREKVRYYRQLCQDYLFFTGLNLTGLLFGAFGFGKADGFLEGIEVFIIDQSSSSSHEYER
jgi:hypothetical protein